jgi:hypothetical protein
MRHSGDLENFRDRPAMPWRMYQARLNMLRPAFVRPRAKGFAVLCLAVVLAGLMQLTVVGLHCSPKTTSGVGASSVNVALDHIPCPHAINGASGQTSPDDGPPRDDCCSCPICQSLRLAAVLPESYVLIVHRVASHEFVQFDAQLFNPRAPRSSAQPRAPPISI